MPVSRRSSLIPAALLFGSLLIAGCSTVLGALATLTVSNSSVTLTAGGAPETIYVTAKDLTGAEDSWTAVSSNTAVAIVGTKLSKSFEITPVSQGTAMITVKSGSGKQVTIDVVVNSSGGGGGGGTSSGDAMLQSLTASGLYFSFNSSGATFSATAGSGLSSTTVTATPSQAGANVTINGQAGTSRVVTLNAASTTITVVVTAPDGQTTRSYSLLVTKSAAVNTDASLSYLAASGINLSFNPTTTAYSLSAPNTLATTTITAVATQGNASLTIQGYMASPASVTLEAGTTTVVVEVTAPDGLTTKTYTLTITKEAPLSSDATLSNLAVGNLAVGFSPATTNYSFPVANSVASIAITATPKETGSSVSIKGVAGASSVVTLAVGLNEIPIAVTAPDGTTKKTYYVTITRAVSNDATLSAFSASGLTFSFISTGTEYTVTAPSTILSTTVNATPTQAASTCEISVNGNVTASGTGTLAKGKNTIKATVTAPDGATKKVYTLTVNVQLPAPVIKVGAASYYAYNNSYNIYLSWDMDAYTAYAPDTVQSRTIYVSTSKNGTYDRVGSTTGSALYHSGTPATTYYFKMTVTDAYGIESDFSPIAAGTTCGDSAGMPVVRQVPYYGASSQLPANVPTGYNMTVITGPGNSLPASLAPILRFGGYEYWCYTYGDSFMIVLYDSAGNIVAEKPAAGDRYLWGITVDTAAKTIAFKGQYAGIPGPDPDGIGIVFNWSELSPDALLSATR